MTTPLETAVRQLFADIAGTDSTGDPVPQLHNPLDVLEEIRQHIENLELLLLKSENDAERRNVVKSRLDPDEIQMIDYLREEQTKQRVENIMKLISQEVMSSED